MKDINKSTTWCWDGSVDRLGLGEGEGARGNGRETAQSLPPAWKQIDLPSPPVMSADKRVSTRTAPSVLITLEHYGVIKTR